MDGETAKPIDGGRLPPLESCPEMVGRTLAHYEILDKLGEGGMGEVYRARDTKLDRDVAIKVLPEELASDEERVARFEREAKLLASLNHPNIAGIYGFEENAIVLELVEGPTLAERIEQGPIPVDEAIAIAKQIAEALEAGHEAGVVHRDLKPANIKVKEDGTVKVLDYGLAKALEGDAATEADSELSQSPTLTRQGTQIGVILGTAAYMSPEQAKGKRVDKRTDVWAFGAVLYEMLTGQRAFAGEDVSDTLAAVLRAVPDFDALPSGLPGSTRAVLELCLTKDARERTRDIGDVRLALRGAFAAAIDPIARPVPDTSWSSGTVLALALALCFTAGAVVWMATRSEVTPQRVMRFSVPLPAGQSLTGRPHQVLAVSPDGSRLAYSANDQLYVRDIGELRAVPIEGTEGAQSPFFSPDGEWVAFYRTGKLMKVTVGGGVPVELCDARPPWGASWSAGGAIVFGQVSRGIVQVSAEGGVPEVVVPIEEPRLGHGPQVLPGGDAVLFTLGELTRWDDAEIVVHTIASGATKTLLEGGRDARYLPSGHLAYFVGGTMFAVPFDLDRLEVTGAPVASLEGVMEATEGLTGSIQASVSDNGSLAYVRESQQRRVLVWVDRNGVEEPIAAEPGSYESPRISPDGRLVAMTVGGGAESDIWTWDFGRETLSRVTFEPGLDAYPTWTPDGSRIVFVSRREIDQPRLHWKAADGTGEVEVLAEPAGGGTFPSTFTPDGRQMLLHHGSGRSDDLSLLTIDGGFEPLLDSEFSERNGVLSRDGRWLAYESNDSGQHEIHVRPFPNTDDGRWQITRGGGSRPLWAPDTDELFYVAPGRRLMAVRVQTEPGFVPGNPEELFVLSSGYTRLSQTQFEIHARDFDISPDGERFLMVKENANDAPTEILFVVNWFAELERLVPAS